MEKNCVDKFGRMWFAVYNQQFDRDAGLDHGRFSLNWIAADGSGATHFICLATQATAGRQQPDRFNEKSGMMPPQYRVPDMYQKSTWYIETDLKQRSALGGDCFQIFPVYVKTETGTTRGEFFIHINLNGVGSLGCTVTNKTRLDAIKREMKNLQELGVSVIPYYVFYS